MSQIRPDNHLLRDARVYLSGPMDFVADRAIEKRSGWRTRVAEFLQSLGTTVFDPWFKPLVKGLGIKGEEDETSIEIRNRWSFEPGSQGAIQRAECAEIFRDTMHIDLRMVDLSDLVIAYCPTNIYSVGTPHEIVLARQQHKPVLFVSPRFEANPAGTPSLWYMALVGSENFYDGFGFAEFAAEFGWERTYLDAREAGYPPRRPLLPHLRQIAQGQYPQRWDSRQAAFVPNDDWLILDIIKRREDKAE